jgi:hypothetical protein
VMGCFALTAIIFIIIKFAWKTIIN